MKAEKIVASVSDSPEPRNRLRVETVRHMVCCFNQLHQSCIAQIFSLPSQAPGKSQAQLDTSEPKDR